MVLTVIEGVGHEAAGRIDQQVTVHALVIAHHQGTRAAMLKLPRSSNLRCSHPLEAHGLVADAADTRTLLESSNWKDRSHQI